MNRNRLRYAAAVAFIATVALSACKKPEEAAPPPPVVVAPPLAPAPPSAPTAWVVSVDLGNAVGADMKITTGMTVFDKKDTIIAAVSTTTSNLEATVPGKLEAKWSYQDGQVVNDESKDINFAGTGVTDFQIAKPDGWPVGKYKVEISQDGKVVQSKDFEVK